MHTYEINLFPFKPLFVRVLSTGIRARLPMVFFLKTSTFCFINDRTAFHTIRATLVSSVKTALQPARLQSQEFCRSPDIVFPPLQLSCRARSTQRPGSAQVCLGGQVRGGRATHAVLRRQCLRWDLTRRQKRRPHMVERTGR